MKDKTPDGTAVNGYGNLLGDIKERIRSAQYTALRAVNRELIELYWDIGRMRRLFVAYLQNRGDAVLSGGARGYGQIGQRKPGDGHRRKPFSYLISL